MKHPFAALALASALALVAGACDPALDSGAPAAAVPAPSEPGACLRVDGTTLTVAEVDRLADDILALYPEYTRPHARRLALTNEFLPRLALRHDRAQAWADARKACEALDLEHEDASPWTEEGNWRTLGLALWSSARNRTPGTWSEPVELIGRWVLVRLDARLPADDPQRETLRISLHIFPLLDPAELSVAVQEAIDAAQLEILAPEWGEIVPESWKYRMNAPDPPPQ